MSAKLSWSHYVELLWFNDEIKITYYIKIQTYMNYIDKNVKTIEEDKTIGIIIVKKNDKYIMEYCSDKRISAREYELV